MSDKITQYALNARAEQSAKDLIEERASFEKAKSENTYDAWQDYLDALDDAENDISDIAHQEADSWDWVIYYHYAHELCQNCSRDEAEQSIEDCGGFTGDDITYDTIATQIAYWVVYHAVSEALQDEIEGCRELAVALQESAPE